MTPSFFYEALTYLILRLFLKVKEWLQNLGILDHAAVMHDDDDFEDDVRFHRDGSSRHQ